MASCRLFVKNFPKDATEKKIRDFFAAKGAVTDVALKFTPEGKFRRFGFIGFSDPAEAEEAQRYFDKTFMGTSRLHVELSKDLTEKPRPWSKYSEGSSAYLKAHPEEAEQKRLEAEQQRRTEFEERQRKQKQKKDFLDDVFGTLPDDEKFKEFLAVNQSEKLLWANDEAEKSNEVALKSNPQKATDADSGVEAEELASSSQKKLPKVIYPHVVVVRNLSFKWKRKDLKDFFKDLSVCSIRKCLKPGVKGVAYVAFKNEEDLAKALEKDKCFIQRRRIHIAKHVEASQKDKSEAQRENKAFKEKEIAPDVITDTGRLFIRNLPYSATEAELEELLKPFGPLAELHLSIDPITKKPKGFAFVTFMFPEHAAKAYQALDYTTFHGRLMHVIPGLAKPQDDAGPAKDKKGTGESSFKAEKVAKLKAQAGNTHSWNSLFLGANAVADVMASKYGVEKTKLLGTEAGESVAVRMALGETQIVNETKEFLEKHGVDLSVFKQNVTERSKTVLLVKNLPAGTKETTLWDLFNGKGKQAVRRVVLPPSGVTGLVEFCEPQEARTAFKRLAYTMFKDQPLYLEWAPVNVFSRDATEEESTRPADRDDEKEQAGLSEEQGNAAGQEENSSTTEKSASDVTAIEGATLFVKNLSFATTSDELQKHFASCGALQATVATKVDPRQPGKTLSMGYGFVQFAGPQQAMAALKKLQHSSLDSHTLELKVSRREVQVPGLVVARKEQKLGKASTKILVRNVPFQASRREIHELFAVFGSLKTVRLPRKMFGGDSGEHRGFAFVEFVTKADAKRAFESLCQSTHLYGRRLVLEWAAEDEEDTEALRRKTAEQFLEGSSGKKLRKGDLMDTLEGGGSQQKGV